MFPYFGGKTRLAATYQAPRFPTIVEPFAGGAAYSMYWLARDSSARAVLIERDPQVVELWKMLLALDPMDVWHYPCPKEGEWGNDLFWAVAANDPTRLPAIANSGRFKVSPRLAEVFPTVRERVAMTLGLVRNRVDVELGDYQEAPDIEATWFIDPPYQNQGHRYTYGATSIDFAFLGSWCRSRRGQVIVCEYEGADWLPFDPHRSDSSQDGQSKTEVVWYSDPEPTLFSEVSA